MDYTSSYNYTCVKLFIFIVLSFKVANSQTCPWCRANNCPQGGCTIGCTHKGFLHPVCKVNCPAGKCGHHCFSKCPSRCATTCELGSCDCMSSRCPYCIHKDESLEVGGSASITCSIATFGGFNALKIPSIAGVFQIEIKAQKDGQVFKVVKYANLNPVTKDIYYKNPRYSYEFAGMLDGPTIAGYSLTNINNSLARVTITVNDIQCQDAVRFICEISYVVALADRPKFGINWVSGFTGGPYTKYIDFYPGAELEFSAIYHDSQITYSCNTAYPEGKTDCHSNVVDPDGNEANVTWAYWKTCSKESLAYLRGHSCVKRTRITRTLTYDPDKHQEISCNLINTGDGTNVIKKTISLHKLPCNRHISLYVFKYLPVLVSCLCALLIVVYSVLFASWVAQGTDKYGSRRDDALRRCRRCWGRCCCCLCAAGNVKVVKPNGTTVTKNWLGFEVTDYEDSDSTQSYWDHSDDSIGFVSRYA